MSKHYPGYSTPRIGRQIDLSWKRGLAAWVIALVALYGLVFLLTTVQGSGVSPSYTCAPGTTYTTKECQ